MTIEFYQNEDRYWKCCPCGCDPNVTLYYGRVDDGAGGWYEFDLVGDLNDSSGVDGDGMIHFEGTYNDGVDDYDVFLAWDTNVLQWYINDGGFTFGGSTTRCDAVGDYDSVFEVSLTAFT